MVLYIHDGSFDGFLTCIYDSYYSNIKPNEILDKRYYENQLFYEPYYIDTDTEKSNKVLKSLITQCGNETLYNVYYSFLCDTPPSHTLIYKYIKLAFKLKKDVNLHLHNEIVYSVVSLKDRVLKESHRMKGFLRFTSIDNKLLYSVIEPDNNILPIIAPHFQNRLPKENWIIHDAKRSLALVYDKEKYFLLEDSKHSFMNIKKDLYTDLWKEYFKSTTIEERLNIKLQKRSMPQRYWKHLHEID
ncbi:TIGR03915 family putative DNA repair protein [Clostridium amazonitimonense]|uniref:TIGR03915 family putative DNA repair protein n=1 Tax=Clostridium amazonitimonense TaxID=1499689 RepID=UPI000509C6DD|nr:TIGR03915 family putative DNA repair protein [Clostridium amazonitimonense]